ncbi:hypothetical protein BD410DRAFT_766411 [Rickenella mellea]|uniref:G-patch domain-containing protein n=1 Tax=Rickenella mellea TaxID=50990 RepID=A0A4Y7QCN7_9AGAM|nr:hypothetical protein BD410DRAFT_766411 [Rickenella mellea]
MSSSKVSFTIRRPSPISRQGSSGPESDKESNFKVPPLPRHLTDSGRSTPTSPLVNGHRNGRPVKRTPSRRDEADSSDEENEAVDEMVTGFDQFGVQRCVIFSNQTRSGPQLTEAPSFEGPLVIPPLQNRDWREVARKRKATDMYVPASAKAPTGADGSVGGLGTRDAINSGPQVAGLIIREKRIKTEDIVMDGFVDEDTAAVEIKVEAPAKEETDDERALRMLLAGANGETPGDGPTIDVIPSSGNDLAYTRPADETDAYRRDVVTRPDEATLDDYDRVPVEAFGAALLRGMGWKPGTAASRTRTGPAEPWVPTARPSLLGIGAKERVLEDDGSKDNKKGKSRPERRYVPVIKKEVEGSSSAPVSRRSSISPSRRDKERDRDRDRSYDRDRRRDRDRDYGSDRERDSRRDRDRRDRDRDRERNRDGRR